MWSSSLLMAKKLTLTDNTLTITFWQAAGLIPATFILATQVWVWPNLEQLFMFFSNSNSRDINPLVFK